MVTQRIDRLGVAEQLALKVASVVGRVFAAAVVNEVFPIEELRGRVDGHLQSLSQRGLTSPEDAATDLTYLFRHIVTQQVIYNLMLFAQRRELHLAVADWYERSVDDLTPHHPLIAHHLVRAENYERAIPYLVEAGDQALAKFACREALDFLSEAARLDAERPGGADPALQSHCNIQRGHALYVLARREEAADAFTRGLATTRAPIPTSRTGRVLALVRELGLQLLRLRFPGRFCSLAPEAEHQTLRRLATAHTVMARIAYIRNDKLGGVLGGLQGLNVAERAGPSVELAEALAVMAPVADVAGMPAAAAEYDARARALLPQITDPAPRVTILLSSAVHQGQNCQWSRSIESLEEVVRLARSISNWRNLQAGLQGIGRVNLRWGRFEAAAEGYEQMLQLGRRTDNGQAEAWGLGGLLQLQHPPYDTRWAAQVEELRQVLAREAGREHLSPADHALSRARIAGALWRLGRHDEAVAEAEAASEVALQTGAVATYTMDTITWALEVLLGQWARLGDAGVVHRPRVSKLMAALRGYRKTFPFCAPIYLRLQGTRWALQGDRDQAVRAWKQGLVAAEERDMPYELARCHQALAEHLPQDAPERQTHRQQAHVLFQRMNATCDLAALEALG